MKKSLKNKYVALLLAFGALLVPGYFAYAAQNTPQKVMLKYASSVAKSPSVSKHMDASYRYSDKIDGKDLVVSLSESSDIDPTNPVNPVLSSLVSGSIKSGNESYSVSGVPVIMKDLVLYVNLNQIPGLDSEIKDYDGWVKLDFNKAMGSDSVDLNASYADIQGLQKAFVSSLDMKKLVTYKYLNRESINGVATYHYRLTLNKSYLKSRVVAFLDSKVLSDFALKNGEDQAAFAADKADMKKAVNQIFDAVSITKSEIWLGVNDTMLYKTNIEMSLPSLAGAIDALASADNISDINPQDMGALAKTKAKAKLAINITNSNYGKPVSVALPSKAMDLMSELDKMGNSNGFSFQSLGKEIEQAILK